MTGIWRGEVRSFRYCLDLVQTANHVSGLLHVGGFERTGNISGVNYYPVINLSGFFIKHGAAFYGKWVDNDTISGTLKYQEDSAEFTFKRSGDQKCR
jgi:hypothetical protein